MKTRVLKKTGERFPDYGCECGFFVKAGGKRLEFWRKNVGRKSVAASAFTEEEIEDLPKGFSDTQFIEYVKKYGVLCAQEFLPCCDMIKPSRARLILDPFYPSPELVTWCKEIFGIDPRDYATSIMAVFGRYSFDVIAWEKHLIAKHGYSSDSIVSIRDFMVSKFGKQVTDLFDAFFVRSKVNEDAPAEASAV